MKEFMYSVLGTVYSVKIGGNEELGMSENNIGECKIYAKEILISNDMKDCKTEAELKNRIRETVAHEFLHAYLNECGIELDEDVEELLCTFYMKNWGKLHSDIKNSLKELGVI